MFHLLFLVLLLLVGLECAVAAPAPYANAAQFVAAGGTISDNCVGTIIVSMTNEVSAPGICANSFILSRTYTATDVCGNFASCVQTITVADMTPPTITCPANCQFNLFYRSSCC